MTYWKNSIGSFSLYDIKFAGILILLIVPLAYMTLFALQNYQAIPLLQSWTEDKKVYLLTSPTLKKMYQLQGMDYDDYVTRIDAMSDLCEEYAYKVKEIDTMQLDTIPSNGIVLVLDMMALSKLEISKIDAFVSNGGKILFNFTSGFQDASFKYQEDNLVHRITGFTLNKKSNMVQIPKEYQVSLSTKLLSAVTQYLPKGKGLPLPLYDPLPVFETHIQPDAYMTNWTQVNYPNIGKKNLTDTQSGLIWHGFKEKGKWVYFSFPSYVFTENKLSEYQKLFHGMLSYLDKKATVQLYPYIDAKNAVFISEDTEYKFENFGKFNNLSKTHKFPMTAFCVAKLAQSHTSLMDAARKNPFLELGSHSYNHKKIVGQDSSVYEQETLGSKKVLEVYAKSPLLGFRPPREELDDTLLEYLDDAEYKYIFGAADNYLYPSFKDKLLIIPKHGSDDYQYLVNLDWNAKKILYTMKQEMKTVTNLNGIYTLSIHTHLLNNGKNSKILEKFVQYIQKKPTQFTPMNGKMIFNRVVRYHKMQLNTKFSENRIIMTIDNISKIPVKNLHYEITVDPNMQLNKVESEMFGLKTTLLKKSRTQYILTVDVIQPKSQIVLFLKYVQNS